MVLLPSNDSAITFCGSTVARIAQLPFAAVHVPDMLTVALPPAAIAFVKEPFSVCEPLMVTRTATPEAGDASSPWFFTTTEKPTAFPADGFAGVQFIAWTTRSAPGFWPMVRAFDFELLFSENSAIVLSGSTTAETVYVPCEEDHVVAAVIVAEPLAWIGVA